MSSRMAGLGVPRSCALVMTLACAPILGTQHVARPTVVVGFFDAGWPGPSGEGAAHVPMAVSGASERGCQSVVDSTATDSSGRFRLMIPPRQRHGWRLCTRLFDGGWDRGGYPLYQYQGRALDSIRVYCRGHGPSGSPECRYVAWGRPMQWPGGEGYDSVPKPPNDAMKLTGDSRTAPAAPLLVDSPAAYRRR